MPPLVEMLISIAGEYIKRHLAQKCQYTASRRAADRHVDARITAFIIRSAFHGDMRW